MLARILRIACGIALGLATAAVAAPAHGTAFSTDNSDLYIATDEDGWGVELVQRADVIFGTIYAYDADNLPIFYTATLFFAGTNASGKAVWVGDLYETQGSWFGAPFDRSKLVYRKVGTMSYVPQFIETGALTFTVDGVTATKQINRLPLKPDNYAGTYLGVYKIVASGCANPTDNDTFYTTAVFNVTQSANALTIVATDSQGGSCTFPGDYTQSGQFGQSRGSFTCTTGIKGGHQIFEMNVSPGDFRGRIIGTDNLGCSLTGNLSGVRQ